MQIRIALLVVFGLWIWIRSSRGLTDIDDVIPILIAFPMAYLLGKPWQFAIQKNGFHVSDKEATTLVICIIMSFVGVLLDWVTILSMTWGVLAYQLVTSKCKQLTQMEARKLTVVALMGFPWIFIDFSFLGWWFRLTGAWVTGSVFQILRFDVIREGTAFWVQGVPIAVEAACAGMNSLQMLMVTGFFLNYLYNRKSPVFWWNALLIMALAWAANTLRVIALSTAAMTYGAEFASGPFHSSSGLFVVGVMLLICWPIMTWQRNTCQQD